MSKNLGQRGGRRKVRRRVRLPSPALERTAIVLLVLTIVASPQLLGGAVEWATALIAIMALLAAVFALLYARLQGTSDRGGHVLAVLLGAVLWTGIQALPLPCAVVSLVADRSVDELNAARAALSLNEAQWCTITRAPGATHATLVQWAAVALLATASFLMSATGHRRKVLWSVVASVLLMGAVGMLHALANAERVFGIYQPLYTSSRLLAPLLNDNNLAGFLLMGIPVLMGLALDAKDGEQRWLLAAGGILLGGLVVMTLSRGGIAVLVLTALLAPLLLANRVRARLGTRRRRRLALALGSTVSLGIAVGVYAASDSLLRELGSDNTNKVELIHTGLSASLQAPLVGVGKGAFAATFTEYFGSAHRALHAENILVQWAAEWGWPIALALLLGLGWPVARIAFRSRDVIKRGAALGVVVIACHNLVDFSLELTGVAVVAAALLAASVSGRSPHDRGKSQPRWLRPLPIAGATVLVCGLLTIGLGWRAERDSLRSMRSELEEHMLAGSERAFDQVLTRAVLLHPSEPVFPLLAGAEYRRRGSARTPVWLNRAMLLAPRWASPRIEASAWLVGLDRREQAMLEIREAAMLAPRRAADAFCALLAAEARPEEAVRSAPSGRAGVRFLAHLARCQAWSEQDRVALDSAVLGRDPGHRGTRLRMARRGLADRTRTEEVTALLDSLIDDAPGDVAPYVLAAKLHLAHGDSARAREYVAQGISNAGPASDLLAMQARVQVQRDEIDEMRRTIEALRTASAGDPSGIAAAAALQAELEESVGNDARALAAYEDAYRLGGGEDNLRHIARLASELGQDRRAYRAHVDLCREMDDERACRSIERNADER